MSDFDFDAAFQKLQNDQAQMMTVTATVARVQKSYADNLIAAGFPMETAERLVEMVTTVVIQELGKLARETWIGNLHEHPH